MQRRERILLVDGGCIQLCGYAQVSYLHPGASRPFMNLDQGIELLILLCCLFTFLSYYFYLFIGALSWTNPGITCFRMIYLLRRATRMSGVICRMLVVTGRSLLRRWRKVRPSAKTAFIFSNAQCAIE